MKLRVRLTEECSQIVESAAESMGIARQDAHIALIRIGWETVQLGKLARAQQAQGHAGLGPAGPSMGPAGPILGPVGPVGPSRPNARAQQAQPNASGASGLGPAGPGTEVALSSYTHTLREEEKSERGACAAVATTDWPWWQWDGSDDRLAARFIAADAAGHDGECCRVGDFLQHGALSIAQDYLRTQQPLTVKQASSLRSAVRKVVGCEQRRRRETAKAERQVIARAADEQARQVAAPKWWLEQQERNVQRLEEKQRGGGGRRKQQPVSGDVAASLPNKSAGQTGKESE